MNRETPLLVVTRAFACPRALVLEAWTHESHIRRWFSPAGCSVPEAEVDFRVGGAFALTMQLPDGTRHEIRASFAEIAPPERLRFVGAVWSGGAEKFRVDTSVAFAEAGEGTELTVTQSYEIFDSEFRTAIGGAREGWRTTLDKLQQEVQRIASAPPRRAVHGEFTISRAFAVTPRELYRAFADPEAKAKWFSGPSGWTELERKADIRAGGRERVQGRFANGLVTTFDAVYLDVVPDERLIYVYEMRLDGAKISASLATLQFAPDPKGSRLALTEQGAFLDGYDDKGAREQGTNGLFDAVERSLSAP